MLIRWSLHAAFTVLMALFIGWGSAVSAAAQMPMQHSQPQSAQHGSAAQHEAHMPAANVNAHAQDCHEQQPDCHQSMQTHPHEQCSSCAAWHCQAPLSAISPAVPLAIAAMAAETAEQAFSPYTAQDLAGCRQEILRPPQA